MSSKKKESSVTTSGVICLKCFKPGHWTFQCPLVSGGKTQGQGKVGANIMTLNDLEKKPRSSEGYCKGGSCSMPSRKKTCKDGYCDLPSKKNSCRDGSCDSSKKGCRGGSWYLPARNTCEGGSCDMPKKKGSSKYASDRCSSKKGCSSRNCGCGCSSKKGSKGNSSKKGCSSGNCGYSSESSYDSDDDGSDCSESDYDSESDSGSEGGGCCG